MEAYLRIVRQVMENGTAKDNRTGINCRTVAGQMFEHDMSEGFPLLTTKRVPFRIVAVELEGFLRGITDKAWYQERKCHIWDEWCSPKVVPYGHDAETRRRMREERDLGPIYGYQWRNFGAAYGSYGCKPCKDGIDQIRNVVETLKRDPNDRRMVVSAWNPHDLRDMALPPCHWGFQLTVIGGRLNLLWNQRSVDVALGLPFNIASYALLLHLFAKESGLAEGRLIGFLADTHVYENHVEGLHTQLSRPPSALPYLATQSFSSIFDWHHDDTMVHSYFPAPTIKFDVAI